MALCVNEILTTNAILCVRGTVEKDKQQPERLRTDRDDISCMHLSIVKNKDLTPYSRIPVQ